MRPQQDRTFLGRIAWILRTTFVTLILIVLIVAIGGAGFLAYLEMQRSFESVTMRVINNSDNITAANERLERLQEQLTALESENPAQQRQIDVLLAEVDSLDSGLTTLEGEIMPDLERQQSLLTTLEENVSTALGSSETAAQELTILTEAMVALQNDINQNRSEIDDLGGSVDGLRTDVESADAMAIEARDMAIAAEAAADVDETLVLFRVWQLITRARLRVAESNLGLAADDVAEAVRTLDLLIAQAPEAEQEPLQMVQSRLALALLSLPDDPDMAAADLENAWDELDGILAAVILPQVEVDTPAATEIDSTPTPTATDVPEEDDTVEEDATATATPAAPTATATPDA